MTISITISGDSHDTFREEFARVAHMIGAIRVEDLGDGMVAVPVSREKFEQSFLSDTETKPIEHAPEKPKAPAKAAVAAVEAPAVKTPARPDVEGLRSALVKLSKTGHTKQALFGLLRKHGGATLDMVPAENLPALEADIVALVAAHKAAEEA